MGLRKVWTDGGGDDGGVGDVVGGRGIIYCDFLPHWRFAERNWKDLPITNIRIHLDFARGTHKHYAKHAHTAGYVTRMSYVDLACCGNYLYSKSIIKRIICAVSAFYMSNWLTWFVDLCDFAMNVMAYVGIGTVQHTIFAYVRWLHNSE